MSKYFLYFSKMNTRKAICFFTLTLFSSIIFAQNFGGSPAGIQWKQVNTNAARVIFPKGYDSAGIRISAIVQALQQQNVHSLGIKQQKINIVVHPFTNVSNAFVRLAPFESEFYLHQPFDALTNGAVSWDDQLAVHEYRHVQQYNNFNTGLSKTAGILFGENARALANAAAIPDWFFEGDAVYNETFMSSEGRGRLPDFLDGYRQLFADSLHYKYALLRNGSYQKLIPNHYPLGYMLTAYGYEKFGDDFWKNVTHDAASFRPLFYPFQGAVKKYAGISFKQFTENAFAFYRQKMLGEKMDSSIFWATGLKKNDVQNYMLPYSANDGGIIVLKNSFTKIPAFYSIGKDGKESEIAVNDISNESYFSYNNGKIIYSFLQPDIRYANRDFTAIKLLDIQSGETKIIASHSTYFTPDISHDGKNVVVVDMQKALSSSIILMDLNGNKIKQFNSENILFSYPKFSNDDAFIFVLTRNRAGEMGIDKINISLGSMENILLPAKRILGNPVVQGDTLLFTCAHDNIQETWAYEMHPRKLFTTGIGGHNISQATLLPGGNMIASVFTSNGYRLAEIKPIWKEIDSPDTLKGLYVQKPFNREENAFLKDLQATNFEVNAYHKFTHPFHFHSWNPVINVPEYGINIYGQNILNTIQTTLFYTYNSNEKSHQFGINEIYGGWFLEPFFGLSQTWQRSFPLNADTSYTWNEWNTSAGLRLPLNLGGGRQYRRLETNIAFHYNTVDWTGNAKNIYKNYDVPFMQYSIGYSGSIQQAKKQIYPHFAENIYVQYDHTINDLKAKQLNISTRIFLPGFFVTHSLVLQASMQNRDTLRNYFFSNNFEAARGYNSYQFARNWKVGVTYYFPLLCPDYGFKNIVYLLRVRAAVFYDYAKGGGVNIKQQYLFRSAGGEIYFDTKWWNQQPISFGFRYSRLFDYRATSQQPDQWEFIVPVNLFGR